MTKTVPHTFRDGSRRSPALSPQPPERARSYISYVVLARMRASGVNWEENGLRATMDRLTEDYYGFARQKGSPLACGYETPRDLSIIARLDGTLEAWMPQGPLPWSRPPDVPRPPAVEKPHPRPLDAILADGFISGLYARNGWAIPLSDPIFGDLGAQVNALTTLPEKEQLAMMWRLATRLSHVVGRVRAQ